MYLPEDLKAILVEIASMSTSEEYNLRVAGNIALKLEENFHRLIPVAIQRSLDDIRHYLGMYKEVDERLRFLYDKMGEWYLKYRPGPRYQENPIHPSSNPRLRAALVMIRNVCVGRKDPDLAAAGLHAAEALSTMGKAGFDQYTGAAVLLVSTKLHKAWGRFAMPKALTSHLRTIDYYLSEGYISRYRTNPMVMSNVKYGGPYFLGDGKIRSTAASQGFTLGEQNCISRKIEETDVIEVYSPFGEKVKINEIGRTCVKTYGQPRPPRRGDHLWTYGTIDRFQSPKIMEIRHQGRSVLASDGHIYDTQRFEAVESPWYPYTPSIEHPILWWDRTR